MSGPVKFDEKSNPIKNHPQSLLEYVIPTILTRSWYILGRWRVFL